MKVGPRPCKRASSRIRKGSVRVNLKFPRLIQRWTTSLRARRIAWLPEPRWAAKASLLERKCLRIGREMVRSCCADRCKSRPPLAVRGRAARLTLWLQVAAFTTNAAVRHLLELWIWLRKAEEHVGVGQHMAPLDNSYPPCDALHRLAVTLGQPRSPVVHFCQQAQTLEFSSTASVPRHVEASWGVLTRRRFYDAMPCPMRPRRARSDKSRIQTLSIVVR